MSRLLLLFCLVQVLVYVASEGEENAENAENKKKEEKGYYTITAPGTIRPNSNYHVAVSLHKSEEPVKIKVGIENESFKKHETVELEPYSTKLINFEIPKILDGVYNLKAQGLSGLEFNTSEALVYNGGEHIILLQTDKATYKPGDLVQFRVLILDKNTRPAAVDGPISVVITDAAQNRIKQFDNVKLTKGVFAGELQLSTFPILGQWSIDVEAAGEKKSKSFEVDKYVLPKFEVTVDAPKDVARKDGKIKAIVRAKYTYGKPVKGEATIKIRQRFGYWGANTDDITKVVPLDGKASVEFDLENELKQANDWSNYYQIFAEVQETLTGFKQNNTADVTVHRDRYTIERVGANNLYIEDVPFDITVVVKKHDGSPVQDSTNPVEISLLAGHYFGDMDKVTPDNYKTEAKLDENGMATAQFTIPKSKNEYYSVKAKYLDVESYVGSLSKSEPQSGSFFKAEILTDKPTLDKDVTVKVSSNSNLESFFYQIVGRGDIIESGKIEVPEGKNSHEFKIKPTFDLVPSATVFVYFIKNGEIVHDEQKINFEEQLENYVKVNTPTQSRPGEEIDIKVSTKPDSYIGLLGVDQSVLLLKSGNDISKDAVFSSLRGFEPTVPWRGYYGRRFPGQESGLTFITNVELPKISVPVFPLFGGPPRPLNAGSNLLFGSPAPTVAFAGNKLNTSAAPKPIVSVRKLFPETWIWANVENHKLVVCL